MYIYIAQSRKHLYCARYVNIHYRNIFSECLKQSSEMLSSHADSRRLLYSAISHSISIAPTPSKRCCLQATPETITTTWRVTEIIQQRIPCHQTTNWCDAEAVATACWPICHQGSKDLSVKWVLRPQTEKVRRPNVLCWYRGIVR